MSEGLWIQWIEIWQAQRMGTSLWASLMVLHQTDSIFLVLPCINDYYNDLDGEKRQE